MGRAQHFANFTFSLSCVLYDGYETCLTANEVPDAIRAQLNDTGKPHLFAYKRHEAKIAWPASAVQFSSSYSSSTSSSKASPSQQGLPHYA